MAKRRRLLNSIEGKRPVARARPPYVAEHGLWGMPTVVNNVETLANVPWIIRHGARQYASLGIPGSRGTKVVSLNSLFRRPGLYEVEFGIPVREIVEDIGGGLHSGALRALMIGGPLAGVVPPSLLDTRFGFQELRAIGASVGHGGVIAIDEHTSIPELIHHVFSFAAYESCGKCTPCRLGASRLEEIFRSIVGGRAGTISEQDRMARCRCGAEADQSLWAGHRTGRVRGEYPSSFSRGGIGVLQVTVNGRSRSMRARADDSGGAAGHGGRCSGIVRRSAIGADRWLPAVHRRDQGAGAARRGMHHFRGRRHGNLDAHARNRASAPDATSAAGTRLSEAGL